VLVGLAHDQESLIDRKRNRIRNFMVTLIRRTACESNESILRNWGLPAEDQNWDLVLETEIMTDDGPNLIIQPLAQMCEADGSLKPFNPYRYSFAE
jgi:hypothetical protein